MSGKLKRVWPAAAASLLALSSIAQAANGNNGDMSRAKQRPNGMNTQNGQTMAQVINPPARPVVKDGIDLFLEGEFLWWRPSQDDNQFAAACGFCPAGVTTDANGNPVPLLNTYGMNVLNPDYKMDAGFRIGVGYNMPYDGWDVYLRWTRLHTNASKCAPCQPCCDYYSCEPECEVECNSCDFDFDDCDTGCTSCGEPTCGGCDVCYEPCAPEPCVPGCDPCQVPDCTELMIIADTPCRGTFDAFEQICSASVQWNIKLDLIDLELGREFYVSRQLTLRPHFGLRQAWVDQQQNVFFSSNIAIPLGLNVTDPDYLGDSYVLAGVKNESIFLKNRFRGLGPRAGLDSRWMLGNGVSIIGEVALSLLYGHFTVESNCCTCISGDVYYEGAGDEASDTRPSNLRDSFFTSKGVADLGLGLEWSKTFSDDRFGLTIALLWDNSIYFNQNQQIGIEEFSAPQVEAVVPEERLLPLTQATLSSRRHGDFSTQGLTVRAAIDF